MKSKSKSTLKKQENNAVILLESQPPHLGELLFIANEVNNYDHIYVLVEGKSSVISIPHVVSIWDTVLEVYGDKISLGVSNLDFSSITRLPDDIQSCTILTQSQPIFAHLSSINANVKLSSYAQGYHTIFIRAAYRQGKSLDWLRTHTTLASKKEK